jgi:hypothetical protein
VIGSRCQDQIHRTMAILGVRSADFETRHGTARSGVDRAVKGPGLRYRVPRPMKTKAPRL